MKTAVVATVTGLVAVAVAALLCWPSGTEPEISTVRTAGYEVSLMVQSPKRGANTLDFEITDLSDRPVTVDEVGVELAMPQMGHALPPVAATRTRQGRYRAPNVDIPMSGQWDVTVILPGTEKVVLPLLVNERE
ncbi:FixH family protein [Plantactinospora sp. CA-294935]|uniref:FixH family protein n=1 Tax=Plantactinospora sp. CA-294935 TaxID=3240012 RepID=UPI003D91C513